MQNHTFYHDGIPAFLGEAMASPAMQRLRQVGMNCGCEYTSFPRFRDLRPYSRFDHSLGVALIVWHFTRSEAQAFSGLFHDIATPTFAHVVDFLRGDYLTQEATEAGTEAAIASAPEIQTLLHRLGLTTADVCDYHRYPIADNDVPRLAADRLEYTLGNCVNYGFCPAEAVRQMYADLTVGVNEEGQPELMFRSEDAARAFARAALRCSRVYVSDEDRYAMQRLAELLAEALRLDAISEADLGTTEPQLIAQLQANAQTAALWRDYCGCASIRRAPEPLDNGPWRKIAAKKRYINPMVRGRGRVADLDPAFAEELGRFLSESQDIWLCGGMSECLPD